MKNRKVVYVDMDDVLADFYKAAKDDNGKVLEERMFLPKFFLNLDPVPGAKAGVFQLEKMGFDVWVLSQPFSLLSESYAEKAQWIQMHFPQLVNKIILTQNKGLNVGDYLIDDNLEKWSEKFEQNGGKFIHFCYGGYNNGGLDPEMLWRRIVLMMSKYNPCKD